MKKLKEIVITIFGIIASLLVGAIIGCFINLIY